MGIFGGGPTKYDTDVEKATNENNTTEDWAVIMDICDKAGRSTDEAKNYLKVILKRLSNADPHIAIQAVILLDACVKNSGKTFHLEIASRDFETEYMKLLSKSNYKVVQKLKESLKKWADEDCFKNDPQLNLVPSLYTKLKNEGIDFSNETPTKKTVTLSKDPNVVQSQEEEDQIAKAIELSLKDASSSPRKAGTLSTSLYPSTNVPVTPAPSSAPQKELRKVRALYDFEAAEDNELTFNAGELILVLDSADPNWWKGSNHRGEGLFPANFVSLDLNAEPEPEKKKKSEVEEDNAKGSSSIKELKDLENVKIDEEKINRLLHLIHEADPTDAARDTQEIQDLEQEVNIMGPLIDAELERVDRKHAQLTQLSSDLVEAINLYHTLMPGPQLSSMPKPPYGYPSGMPQMQSMYNNNVPHSMVPACMMGAPYSLPPGQERQFMVHPNMAAMQHFPPGMQPPPPNHMMQQHPIASMPQIGGGGMQSNLPPHSIPSQGMPPPGLHQPVSQQGAPPQTMHRMPPQSMPPQGQFPLPHSLPNFQPGGHIPPNFTQNGPHLVSSQPVQNGPPNGQNYSQQAPNTHIM